MVDQAQAQQQSHGGGRGSRGATKGRGGIGGRGGRGQQQSVPPHSSAQNLANKQQLPASGNINHGFSNQPHAYPIEGIKHVGYAPAQAHIHGSQVKQQLPVLQSQKQSEMNGRGVLSHANGSHHESNGRSSQSANGRVQSPAHATDLKAPAQAPMEDGSTASLDISSEHASDLGAGGYPPHSHATHSLADVFHAPPQAHLPGALMGMDMMYAGAQFPSMMSVPMPMEGPLGAQMGEGFPQGPGHPAHAQLQCQRNLQMVSEQIAQLQVVEQGLLREVEEHSEVARLSDQLKVEEQRRLDMENSHRNTVHLLHSQLNEKDSQLQSLRKELELKESALAEAQHNHQEAACKLSGAERQQAEDKAAQAHTNEQMDRIQSQHQHELNDIKAFHQQQVNALHHRIQELLAASEGAQIGGPPLQMPPMGPPPGMWPMHMPPPGVGPPSLNSGPPHLHPSMPPHTSAPPPVLAPHMAPPSRGGDMRAQFNGGMGPEGTPGRMDLLEEETLVMLLQRLVPVGRANAVPLEASLIHKFEIALVPQSWNDYRPIHGAVHDLVARNAHIFAFNPANGLVYVHEGASHSPHHTQMTPPSGPPTGMMMPHPGHSQMVPPPHGQYPRGMAMVPPPSHAQHLHHTFPHPQHPQLSHGMPASQMGGMPPSSLNQNNLMQNHDPRQTTARFEGSADAAQSQKVQSMSPAPNHSEPEPVVKPVQTPHDGYNGGENAEMYEGGNALPDVFSYGSAGDGFGVGFGSAGYGFQGFEEGNSAVTGEDASSGADPSAGWTNRRHRKSETRERINGENVSAQVGGGRGQRLDRRKQQAQPAVRGAGKPSQEWRGK